MPPGSPTIAHPITMLPEARVLARLPELLARVLLATLPGRAVDVDIQAVVVGSLTCSGVPLQLERAIGNLIDNAVSFQKGHVDISVTGDGDDIVVVVADDGPGIPAKDLPNIFERFFTTRANRSGDIDGGNRSSYGTGLGLAFARAVVHAHGGTLTASSREAPKTGAVFTLRLPLAFAPRPRP
jgi:signal transduction histidine kinase